MPVEDGVASDWLTTGPFTLDGGSKGFATEQTPDEAGIAPRTGDKVEDLSWRR